MTPHLQFLGGAGTVTGSKTLLQCDKNVLIDCGLFQGLKELRLLNWAPLPIEAGRIDTLILTHAHLDHSGYIPLLVRNGFRGRILCTAPTLDLARVLLTDSAKIQEEDADYANRKGYSKHKPARPLYDSRDVLRAMEQFDAVEAGQWRSLSPMTRFQFTPSGHILGSAFVEIETGGVRICFSGDLGRRKPLLYPPRALIREADYLVLESTYGDRLHPAVDPEEQLIRVIRTAHEKGGHLLIPSFAVGRAQELLYLLGRIYRRGAAPTLPVYLDSPMAESATEIFSRHPKWHRLSPREVEEVCGLAVRVRTQEESKRLGDLKESSIIIAGSGMATGGRVLHHMERLLPDPRNTLLFVGYQAPGTRGRLLLDGASEVKFHGQYFAVKAKVESIDVLSAHADQAETLEWLRGFMRPPRKTFLVHGERQSAEALLLKVRDQLGWTCSVPALGEKAALG